MTDQPIMRTDEERDRRSVEERRAQLVQAALEVIATDGLERATTRRITDHADLALGAFHYAFRSKDELLEAVIERLGDHLDTVLRDSAAGQQGSIRAMAEALVRGWWDSVDRQPELQLARYELTVATLRDPRLRPLSAQQHERHIATVTAILAGASDAPEQAEREAAAAFLLATADGLLLQWLLTGDRPAPDDRVGRTMQCLQAVLPGSAAA